LDEAYNRYTFNDEDLPVWFKSEVRSQGPSAAHLLAWPCDPQSDKRQSASKGACKASITVLNPFASRPWHRDTRNAVTVVSVGSHCVGLRCVQERKHMQPIQPVSKAEIEAYKAQFRSIDSRTPKKVAEAKARKRGRVRRTPNLDLAMCAHSEDG
jgi:hypothetical protein